ncbi:tetratricopeptide repeat protein [Dyella terrae]|uniref:tetratricopeptide repeat protein n=1 Tax=Dyella terrae TaxID=522259 RepID=UPI001EFE3A16|nr:tetratricopeptide repeat protein [Dyella terrae]
MNASMPPADAPEAEWLARGRALTLQGHVQTALAIYEQASEHFPASSDIRIGLAGLCWQAGQQERAESLLRAWLTDHHNDDASTFLLVDLLREQGRLGDAADAMRTLFTHGPQSVDTVIRAIETLDDYGRQQDAAAIGEAAIANGANDPRLHAYAGMLAIQLRTVRAYAAALRHRHGDDSGCRRVEYSAWARWPAALPRRATSRFRLLPRTTAAFHAQ